MIPHDYVGHLPVPRPRNRPHFLLLLLLGFGKQEEVEGCVRYTGEGEKRKRCGHSFLLIRTGCRKPWIIRVLTCNENGVLQNSNESRYYALPNLVSCTYT